MASIDVLHPARLGGSRVGACPEPGGRARASAVHVAAEDDGTGVRSTREKFSQLPALGVVRVRSDGSVAGAEVGRAHVDGPGGDAQPPTSFDVGLRVKVAAIGVRDRRLRQHGISEEPAAARIDALQPHAEIDHSREAHVVAGPSGDLGHVALAGLIERDGIRLGVPYPAFRLVNHRWVRHPPVATGQPG